VGAAFQPRFDRRKLGRRSRGEDASPKGEGKGQGSRNL
jgi:hypothetical protein